MIIIAKIILVTFIYVASRKSTSKSSVFLFFIALAYLYDSTIITGVIFSSPIYYVSIGLSLCLVYNISRLKKIPIKSNSKNGLIISYVIIYLFEYIRLVIVDGRIESSFVLYNVFVFLLMASLLTFAMLNNSRVDVVEIIMKPYFIVSTAVIITSITSLFMIIIGYSYAFQPLPAWMDTLTTQISQKEGGTRFFSFLTVIVEDSKSAFQILDYGKFRICGLSREPHIATLFVTPAIFLYSSYLEQQYTKILLILSSLLFIIIAGSTTNIISISIVLGIIIHKYLRAQNRSMFRFKYLLLIIPIIAIILSMPGIMNYFRAQIIDISRIGSSGWGAMQRIVGIFNFKALLGFGVFQDINQYIWYFQSFDYGIIPLGLFAIHFGIVIRTAYKLYYSESKYSYVGLGIIYISIHSLKFGLVQVITSPIYLLYVCAMYIIVNQGNILEQVTYSKMVRNNVKKY
jgi:hypothetical protein